MKQVCCKAWAFFKRDFLTEASYRISFGLQVFNAILIVASYYFLSHVMGKNLQGYATFPFVVLGLCMNTFMTTSMSHLSYSLRGHMQEGTLKPLLVSHTSGLSLALLSAIYPMFRASVEGAIYIAGGVLFGLSLSQVNLAAAGTVFVLSLLAFLSMGLLSASFTLVFKKADPTMWFLNAASMLLGGVIYPVALLPSYLQKLSFLLPITHALSGFRAAVLQGATLGQVLPAVAALAVFCAVAVPGSLLAFALGLRRARVTGTLSHF